MLIAYELKITLEQVWQLSDDEVGWWLAFFKYKGELERKQLQNAKSGKR